MKTLTVAIVLLAALTLSAQAQMGGMGGGRHGRGGDAKADDRKPKVDEKAYKDALKRIPDSKEKYDPWSGARPSDQKAK